MKTNTHTVLKLIEEASAKAAAAGHKLTLFTRASRGFQATCKRCELIIMVDREGVHGSLLSDHCEGPTVSKL